MVSNKMNAYECLTFVIIHGNYQEEDDGDDLTSQEAPVIGFWSGFAWLAAMTAVIALLSEFVVGTIEVTK